MNKLIVTAAVVAGLVMGSSAFAATTSTSSAMPAAKPAATSAAKPAAAATKVDPKTAACEKEWKGQKTHKQSEKAYVKACLAKAA